MCVAVCVTNCQHFVTSAGWQVTLWSHMAREFPYSGVATLRTAILRLPLSYCCTMSDPSVISTFCIPVTPSSPQADLGMFVAPKQGLGK